MIPDINVFGPLMIYLMLRQVYSILVITKYRSNSLVCAKIFNQTS